MGYSTEKEMDEVLGAIKEVWKTAPYLRFGQLVVDVLGVDPFYTSNETVTSEFRKSKDRFQQRGF